MRMQGSNHLQILTPYKKMRNKTRMGLTPSSVRGRDLPLFTMVTFVLSAEPLFSVQNHCYQCRIIVLIKGVLFLNDHVTQLMVWEVPSSLNILFDVMVWKIPVYHPALVVKFYRVNLESLITLLIDI